TQAIEDLQAVIKLQPTHLSWYQLTLEPNTLFYNRPPALPDDEQKWEMQCRGQSLLAEHGYTQYEVSAYAQDGKHCRHNLNYWKFGDYIGIGAGAHGKITTAAQGVIQRTWKKRRPNDYLAAAGTRQCVDGQRELAEAEALFEFALNRLRLKQAFSLNEFEAACGLGRNRILPMVQQAQSDGLLNLDGDHVQHTVQGWQYLDDLLQRFLP
ncbi:MAG: YggW family oxidoreductase, partial [Thiogranum sp.]